MPRFLPSRLRELGPEAWVAFLFGWGIPTGTATLQILWPFVLLLGARAMREIGVRRVLLEPVALASLVLLAWMLVGVAYSEKAPLDALLGVAAYKKLILVPFFAAMFVRRPESMRYALHGFLVAMAVTFVLSWPSILQGRSWHRVHESGGTVFKLYITQNLFMAFTAWACWRWAEAQEEPRWRSLGRLAAALCVLSTLVVQGRTGWSTLVVLAVFWMGVRLRGWRLVAGLAAVPLAGALLFAAGGHFRKSVDEIVTGLEDYRRGRIEESVALRTEFYRNTLTMIERAPVVGVGSGAFHDAYQRQTGLTGKRLPPHAHSEYLMIAAEHGLIGLALLAWLGYCLAARSFAMTPFAREIAWGALVVFGAGSVFNTLIHDSSEGHAFALLAGAIAASAFIARAAAGNAGGRSPPSG